MKKKNIAYLLILRFTPMRSTEQLNFCTIIEIILIGKSLCSLEYDLLYIVEFLYVILKCWPNFIVEDNFSFERTMVYLEGFKSKKIFPTWWPTVYISSPNGLLTLGLIPLGLISRWAITIRAKPFWSTFQLV